MRTHLNICSKKVFPWVAAIILIIITIEINVLLKRSSASVSFETLANQVIAACKESSYHPGCYDKEIPKLMKTVSMEDAFKITRIIQEKDKGYWYCHVLGHNLSAIETAENPNQWKDVVARCPSDMCSNGCLHGSFQERFRAESFPTAKISDILKELDGICEARSQWNPTRLGKGSCYHALGHLMMYITAGNIEKSTSLCEQVAKNKAGEDFSHLCFDGAYMQIFQPLEPEDIALVKGKQPTKEHLKAFCADVTGEKHASCWSEGWPLYAEEIKTPNGLITFCSEFSDNAGRLKACYDGIVYVLTAQFNFNEDRIGNLCTALPGEKRGWCFASAASRIIETDWRLVKKSVALCKKADIIATSAGFACYNELILQSTYNFHPNSPEASGLCNALPLPWNQMCLKRQMQKTSNHLQ